MRDRPSMNQNVIQKSGKCNSIVIVDRDKYIENIEKLFMTKVNFRKLL